MHVVSIQLGKNTAESTYSSAGDTHLSYTDVPLCVADIYTSHAVKVLYVFINHIVSMIKYKEHQLHNNTTTMIFQNLDFYNKTVNCDFILFQVENCDIKMWTNYT